MARLAIVPDSYHEHRLAQVLADLFLWCQAAALHTQIHLLRLSLRPLRWSVPLRENVRGAIRQSGMFPLCRSAS